MILLEVLVASVCIQHQGGCTESSSAYYKNSKEAQMTVKNVEEFGKKIVDNNQWVVYVATPTYAVISGQPANFHIYKGWVASLDFKNDIVAIKWSY